jgi:integrase
LQDREPIKTVSERLGHASVTITLTVYGRVMPGDQKRAAGRFAALIAQAGTMIIKTGSIRAVSAAQ